MSTTPSTSSHGYFLVGELRRIADPREGSDYADIYLLRSEATSADRVQVKVGSAEHKQLVVAIENNARSNVTVRLTPPQARMSRAGRPWLAGHLVTAVLDAEPQT